MLEVKIILHHAGTGEVREIASMHIAQVARGLGDARDYHVDAWHEPLPNRLQRHRRRVEDRDGLVREHDRSRPVWDLVHAAIASLGRGVKT